MARRGDDGRLLVLREDLQTLHDEAIALCADLTGATEDLKGSAGFQLNWGRRVKDALENAESI